MSNTLVTNGRATPCDACPLSHCSVGLQVTVICIDCPAFDAAQLRALGVYEGAQVGVVDTRSGMLLDVRGARLALGWQVVSGIRVQPAGRR